MTSSASGLRVLGRIRLSKEADESGTSIERQRESIEQWAKMHGNHVIGWAVDSGISGSVDPFEAPELGQWLTPARLGDWDALVAYRLDRLSRRVIPLNKLFGYIQQHNKTLASVSESLDLSTWIGRLVANVIAGVAEGELEAISERNLGSQKKVRELGRWHGGPPPYGYAAEKRDSGFYLVPQPAERDVIRNEILPRVLAYQSSQSIADVLNAKQIPTRLGPAWSGTVIRRMMRGRALLGQHQHRGKLVVDDEGMPAQRAEPLLSPQEYARVQEALQVRSARVGVKSRREPNPLAGLLFCHYCEERMYFHASKHWVNHYRCSVGSNGCDRSRAVPADIAYELVEEQFLASVGDVQRQARVFVPGGDVRQSVADIEAAIAVCRRERDLGLYEGDDESYLSRLEKLTARKLELEQLPQSAGFEWQPLGETYGQAWKTLDTEQRRTMLLDSKIRVYIGRGLGNEYLWRVYVPEEIQEHLSR
jgi:site-specific DNA recombinase